PMAGFSWVPATTFQGVEASAPAKLRLRGTFATSFRAPSLLQTVGKQTTLEPLFSFSNVDGMPTQGTTSTYLAVRTNGNPQLKPQTSRAFTVGAEWAPLDGLNVTTDYWNFNYTDLIVKQSAQQLLEADFRCDAVNAPGSCDPRVVRDPGGIAQSINTSLANAPSVVTHGLDFSVSYRSKLSEDIGSLSLGATGSYTLAYLIPADSVGPAVRDQLMHCKGERCDVAGYRNFANFARPLPRLRMTFPVSWTLGPHTATVVVHFISGYRDDADADPSPRTDYRSIAAFTTFDLHYEARLDEGAGYKTTFRLGLLNALDSDPPTVNAGFGYDVFTHDPRGRMFYARLTQEM
ncbi:MAG TPA: TonB-dependent receptor, partial [Polyangiales bacterium]|nr:TonB-dependent receptor [Polyangiales bacterium]